MHDGELTKVPSQSETTQLRMRCGDVVILATDGVLDNLFERQIAALVNKPFDR